MHDDVLGRFREFVNHGTVPLTGAWRVDREVGDDLRSRHGNAFPYEDLIALAGGIDGVEFSRETVTVDRGDLPDLGSNNDLRERLVASFTHKLVPPKVAAGVFIRCRIHPAWGVHLAHLRNNRKPESPDSEGDLFPEHDLRLVDDVVTHCIGAAFEAVMPEEGGAVEVNADVAASQFDNRFDGPGDEEGEVVGVGLEPFVDVDVEPYRSRELVTEIVEYVLTPSGLGEVDGEVLRVRRPEGLDLGF